WISDWSPAPAFQSRGSGRDFADGRRSGGGIVSRKGPKPQSESPADFADERRSGGGIVSRKGLPPGTSVGWRERESGMIESRRLDLYCSPRFQPGGMVHCKILRAVGSIYIVAPGFNRGIGFVAKF